MNDLTEKALLAVNVAQAEVRGRPTVSLAVGGFVASSIVVVAGGRAASARATGNLTTWLGLLPDRGSERTAMVAGSIALVGLVALTLLWVAAVNTVRTGRLRERSVWTISAAWALPLIVGPPVADMQVYLDVARGLLQRAGFNPYDVGVARLGQRPIVGMIDPSLHDLHSAAGPLATLIQHLAVAASGAHAVGAVVVLRL